MKLYEYEGKSLFRKAGIPTPPGEVAADAETAQAVAERIGYPVAIKSQVLGGGRGKAGGIRFAETVSELTERVEQLLGRAIDGEPVERLLVEKKITAAKEYYMGVTLHPQTLVPVLILSLAGGVDIEQLAQYAPEKVFQTELDPTQTYRLYHILDIAAQAGLQENELLRVSDTLFRLVECYFDYEAITAEINPLIITPDGEVVAADAKLEIDDSALFRLSEIKAFVRSSTAADPLEEEAAALGVSYVRMGNGNIGIISGGAGLAMASMDTVTACGGVPANFLDLGGGTPPEKAAAALRIVLKTPGVEGVLFNVFGGINNCSEIAQGIAQVIDDLKPAQTIVIKMRGYSQEEGWALLEERDVPIIKHGTTEEAVGLLFEEMRKARGGRHGHSG